MNWRMRVLQTLALPLGHGTILERVTRLACIFTYVKIKVWLGQALASGAHPRRIKIFEPSPPNSIKIKAVLLDGLNFMERVTRLELATSTLARWRSTG